MLLKSRATVGYSQNICCNKHSYAIIEYVSMHASSPARRVSLSKCYERCRGRGVPIPVPATLDNLFIVLIFFLDRMDLLVFFWQKVLIFLNHLSHHFLTSVDPFFPIVFRILQIFILWNEIKDARSAMPLIQYNKWHGNACNRFTYAADSKYSTFFQLLGKRNDVKVKEAWRW